MRTFRFDKLIRDSIIESMIANGEKPEYHTCSDEEYVAALIAKLQEEAVELEPGATAAELTAELADLTEVMEALRVAIGVTAEDLAQARQAKNVKAGAFEKRIWVDTVTLQDDNPWISHLEQHSDRYPEIS